MKFLLTSAEGAELLGISERAFHNRRRVDPAFPPARALGPRSIRFVRSEIERYAADLPAVKSDEPQQLVAARAVRSAGGVVAPVPFGGLPP
jgi:predicted DNA-binding transcriptional regulator AlpA